MHDLGALMTDFGDPALGRRYTAEAAAFRPVVLQAIERVTSRTTEPPFVPIALDGGEPVHSPILHYRIGSYWNIIIGYSIGSGIFPAGSEQENWIPHYQERHGGIFLGMVRSGGDTFNFWTGPERVNPLYGTRYALDSLRRDDTARALVSFYGMLAHGFTRNTFVAGEGASVEPVAFTDGAGTAAGSPGSNVTDRRCGCRVISPGRGSAPASTPPCCSPRASSRCTWTRWWCCSRGMPSWGRGLRRPT